jgi:Ca2+/Na+ antiporter
MNRLYTTRFSFTVILFLLSLGAWAQTVKDSTSTSSSIDEVMRSHDKIYVVMTVCIVILLVFFLYLVRIDRKVSKKEKMM